MLKERDLFVVDLAELFVVVRCYLLIKSPPDTFFRELIVLIILNVLLTLSDDTYIYTMHIHTIHTYA